MNVVSINVGAKKVDNIVNLEAYKEAKEATELYNILVGPDAPDFYTEFINETPISHKDKADK